MTELPRVDMPQVDMPGLDGVETSLILHRCTEANFAQRLVIARRQPGATHSRHYPILLTKAQVLELIDHLIDRVDLLRDDIPKGTAS